MYTDQSVHYIVRHSFRSPLNFKISIPRNILTSPEYLIDLKVLLLRVQELSYILIALTYTFTMCTLEGYGGKVKNTQETVVKGKKNIWRQNLKF
jgi:hypothetical protein